MREETVKKIEKLLSLPENQKFKHNLENMDFEILKKMRDTICIGVECENIRPSRTDDVRLKKLILDVDCYDYYIEKRKGENV